MSVTNLTGTKWKINSITCTAGYGQFGIYGTAYDQYGELKVPGDQIDFMYIGYCLNFKTGLYTAANYILINQGPTYLAIGDVLEFNETNAGTDATNTNLITWLQNNAEQLTPPEPAGYEVTFVTNGGTSVTNLEDVEELPTPLPIPTKANNIFVGWFYDSEFEEQAFSGDEIEDNVTLYAKWYSNMSDFYQDVADEIRSKNGETEPIKHTDFAYKIKNIQGAKPEETKTITSPDFSSGNVVITPDAGKVLTEVTVVKDNDLVPENIVKDVDIFGVVGTAETVVELTQAQYDALTTKDANTYYLITG